MCVLQKTLKASQTCSPRMRVSFPWKDKCDLLRWQVTPPTCSFLAPKFNFLDSFFPPLFGDSLVSFQPINRRLRCIFQLEKLSNELMPKFVHKSLLSSPQSKLFSSLLQSSSLGVGLTSLKNTFTYTKPNTLSFFPLCFRIQHHPWSLHSSCKLQWRQEEAISLVSLLVALMQC